MINTFNYTTGNAMKYNRSDYVGYYNITDGILTSGKQYSSNSLPLEIDSTVNGGFISSGLQFNYNPLIDTNLPNDHTSVCFGSNEIVNANSINVKIDKIIENYYEIYKRCSIITNDIPNGYTSIASITSVGGNVINWNDASSVSAYSLSTINTELTGIEDIIVKDIPNSLYKNILFKTYSSYFIYKYSVFFNTFQLTASANRTDFTSNTLFQRIKGIDLDDEGNLYVCDNINKQVYKISIASTINNSRVQLNNPKLLAFNSDLKSPDIVRVIRNDLFIYDSESYSINLYNSKLTFISKFSNRRLFQTDTPVSIDIDTTSNLLYILTKTGKILKIDKSLTGSNVIVDLNIQLDVNEECKSIKFSKNNSNIVYISTNRQLYKFFVDRLPQQVGRFIWENTTILSTSNLSFDILDVSENYDYIVIYDSNRTMIFLESNETTSTLEKDYYNIYTTSDIHLSNDYFNNITINNMIYKMIYNHDLFVSYIQSRFVYEYVDQNLLLSKIQVLDGNALSGATVSKTYDNFVGINENVIPQVFNRVFGKILEYQYSIAKLIQPLILNKKYPESQVVVF